MPQTNTADRLDNYRKVRDKGKQWLLEQLNEDGSPGPVQERIFYYRVPWALAVTGEAGAAHRAVDWISRHMFTESGEFAGVSPAGGFEKQYGSYPASCLAVGATWLQRADIVFPGMRHLLSWQNPNSGGFFNRITGPPADREEELCPTCQAGMALLLHGNLDAALRAGQWLRELWELQPDVGQQLYVVRSPSGGLADRFPQDSAASYVVRKDDPWQHHFNSGIAAAFLAQLFMAAGDASWLELARAYQDFSMTTDDCQFRSAQICKSGWGSGLLYVATREDPYRDWTFRIGDWFAESQQADGHWENTKFWTPNPTLADNIEITAEFVIHVSNILGYLSL